jgi:hypothetical protein
MVLKRGVGGRLLKGPGGSLARGTGCCCKCELGALECLVSGCVTYGSSVCCAGCGDFLRVTFGTITASGTGEHAVGVAAVASALSGATVDVALVSIEEESHWRYVSEILAFDGGYGYYFVVRVRGIAFAGTQVTWALYMDLYRISIADYRRGDCGSGENIEGGFQPAGGGTSNGNCLGVTDANIPLATAGDGALSMVAPAVSLVVHSGCEPIADCEALASSLMVTSGCWSGTVNYVSNCGWTLAEEECGSEECPCTDTYVSVEHTAAAGGFCGWIVTITRRTFVMADGYCGELSEVQTLRAYKVGGSGPVGEYSIDSESGCLGMVEVS